MFIKSNNRFAGALSMIYRKLSSQGGVADIRGKRGTTILGAAIAVSTLLAANSVALAAYAGAPDNSLTMYGITLYGTVDIGLQYETHGTPVNDYFSARSRPGNPTTTAPL